MGRSSHVSTSTQRISSFQVNQSSYGASIRLVFGTAMISGVLADYQDFTAIAHTTTTSSGGKGGGGVTQSSTDYTYTVAGVIALCEGTIGGVGTIWANDKTTSPYALDLTVFTGAKAQGAWGYMLSRHPDHALTYSGTAYIAGVVDLGSSASLPNMNFEVYGLCQTVSPPMFSKLQYTKTDLHYAERHEAGGKPGEQVYYRLDDTFTIYPCDSVISVVGYDSSGNSFHTTSDNGQVLISSSSASADEKVFPSGLLSVLYTTTITNRVATIHVDSGIEATYKPFAYVVVTYAVNTSTSVGTPTNQKMQQFSYTKEIEISNFQANRWVDEYVFNSATGTGSWVRLDSKYYEIEQSKDAYEQVKPGVYTYKFNFDDREDGAYRADPTYVRIYYTAIQASVDYTPTDANPRDIIYTLLTSTVYGENFPDVLIDEEALATYSTFCKNNGILISPVYTDQNACSDIITSLMECTNSEYVFSQGKVKIIPYWDGLPPNYAITDKNIIDQGEDTLLVERTSQADTYNIIPLEHTSRADQYNSNVVYATDEGDIELHGVRQAGTYSHPEIMNQSLAQAIAQLILQRQLYNRNRYTIKLGQEFILLEPMDAATLESQLANLGLTSVRVIEIVESAEDYSLEITFEDNLSGVSTAPSYSVQETDRATTNTNAEPGDVNAPIMFEAPGPLVESATGYELWIYASGGNKWWGGCNVWVSLDNESYRLVGTIKQPARQGVITNSFPVHASPDTEDVLGVDLSMSRSNLLSFSQQEADNYTSLCWISGEENGEFISYQNANLTGLYKYNLSYFRRGIYGSHIKTHDANSQFVRCDSGIALKIPFGSNEIGTTYFVKFVSYNVFGTVEQDISEIAPYVITLKGYNKKSVTESGTETLTRNVVKTISYNYTYQSAPYPQATIINGYVGDVIQVTNMTTTSFDVYFENADETIEEQERTINYIVYGV